MARVVKVVCAATKKRWRGTPRRPASGGAGGYTGPVNLPPDAQSQFGNPIRKVASYQWIEDAVDTGADSRAERGEPPGQGTACALHCRRSRTQQHGHDSLSSQPQGRSLACCWLLQERQFCGHMHLCVVHDAYSKEHGPVH